MRYLHYDVFTDTKFEGNQLAVFHDARGLDTKQMQAITKEMNFSECTFILPAEAPGTDVRMRIFTPGTELPMAGHPTIGSTFALAELGVIAKGRESFVFGLGVGPTKVELTWEGDRLSFAWMDQRPAEFRAPVSPRPDIIAAVTDRTNSGASSGTTGGMARPVGSGDSGTGTSCSAATALSTAASLRRTTSLPRLP